MGDKVRYRPPKSRCVAIVDSGGLSRCIMWVDRLIRREEEAEASRTSMEEKLNGRPAGIQTYESKKKIDNTGYA